MRTRGVALTPYSVLRHPVQTVERVFVPVMGRLGIVADELGNAVVVRGADAECRRTSYFNRAIGPIDIQVALGSVALLVASAVSSMWSTV